MTNIDLLQIGHERHGDARMMVKINVSDSPHVKLPSAHRHRFYAVYWIHEGRGVHSIDFCDYEIMPDRVFFVRPDQVHFMQVRDAARYSAIQFTEEYFQLCAKIDHLNPPTFIDLVDDSVRQRLHVLFSLIDNENSGNLSEKKLMLQGEILLLMTELSRCCGDDKNVKTLPEILAKYRNLIELEFRQKHQVSEYADELGISPNYLNVLAKKHLGLSALQLINSRILLEIKRQLLENEKTVSEIAFGVGFDELSYFSRFFRRMEGISPVEFRERMNKMYQRQQSN